MSSPKTNKGTPRNQLVMVRLVDGTKMKFTNTGGFSTYEDLHKELQSVKGIHVMLADVTKLGYSNS